MKRNQLKLLIKPTHRCTKQCEYCYDKDFLETIKTDMTLDMVEKIAILSNAAAQQVTWIWHGGEFLLMGQDWLKEAHKIIRKHIHNVRISGQTNGDLLSDDMIAFLIKEKVGVGISYDGFVHEETRGGDREQLMNKIMKLKKQRQETGVIMVVNEKSVDYLIETYEHLKEYGFNSLSFNWVFPNNEQEKNKINTSLDDYIGKWKELFDHMFYDQSGATEQTLMSIIDNILNGKKVPCVYRNCIDQWLCINPIGDIYPCDRYFPKQYIMGNLEEIKYSLVEAFASDSYKYYRNDWTATIKYCRNNCELSDFCSGGCPGNSVVENGRSNRPSERWCHIYKSLFWYIFDRIKDLSAQDLKSINPTISRQLMGLGYRSLSLINSMTYDVIDAKKGGA